MRFQEYYFAGCCSCCCCCKGLDELPDDYLVHAHEPTAVKFSGESQIVRVEPPPHIERRPERDRTSHSDRPIHVRDPQEPVAGPSSRRIHDRDTGSVPQHSDVSKHSRRQNGSPSGRSHQHASRKPATARERY